MILDLRTIYVVAALTALVTGLVQAAAWSTGRFGRWPGWWATSSIAIAAGGFGVAARGMMPSFVSISLSNSISALGYFLMLLGVREFAGLRPRWPLCLALVTLGVIPLFGWREEVDFGPRIAWLCLLCAACDIAISVHAVRLARHEGLRTAWIMLGLFAPTVLLFLLRGWLALTGRMGPTLLTAGSGASFWLAAIAAVFIMLRGSTLLLVAAERDQQALEVLARRDGLTGALNRVGLDRLLQTMRGGVALAIIDLDHFKTLNDRLGHVRGDAVLRRLAEVALLAVGTQGALARLGGDEFLLVLPDADEREAALLGDRIRGDFAAAMAVMLPGESPPTLSIGTAGGRPDRDGLDAILHRADQALYAAKRGGRDRVVGDAAVLR